MQTNQALQFAVHKMHGMHKQEHYLIDVSKMHAKMKGDHCLTPVSSAAKHHV